ncbi:unnamed protein product [Phyllotreta striolata]|uniref:Nardilysin n=1 Tax=Phyllotreta striolata TaxID=444603 RepID=A0A9N9TWP1_PHYSR|nr:unnamed protein product [Phyllotreta striolata]
MKLNSKLRNYFSTFSRLLGLNSSRKSFRYKKSDFTMSAAQKKCELLPLPIKSESDKKEYRVIKLENELVACLVSDLSPLSILANLNESDDDNEEDTTSDDESESSFNSASGSESMDTSSDEKEINEEKMAAAALCVGVGSFSDPADVPGMAHFLEHMVFMGSEKYPEENDFDAFIKKSGGSNNASTDMEHTCFNFEVLEKHLPLALDKFSQFFIEPLMKKGAMTREREAIDSEFQMALPSDSSRKEQLLFSLAKSNSPVNSFGWGNLQTLRDNIPDNKLYDGVHKFRKRHYSAHRMTLAIQARMPLDTLEELVIDCFSNVPNNRLKKDDFSAYANDVFDTPAFNKIYYIKPVKELIKLELTWCLPSLLHKYRSKPMQYVSYLLGDEGKGSLLSYLKRRMWAISAQAGNEESDSEHNTMYALFSMSLTLTDEGLKHLHEVIEAVFSYISLIKKVGPQRRLFDEIKLISNTSFRFATEDTPLNNVESLSESMQLYPPEDYMAGSELYYEFDPQAIMMVMEHLTPRKLNVMVTTKDLPEGVVFDRTEKWFGTEYVDVTIPEAVMKKWLDVEPYPELNVPPMNPFLTDNFSILPDEPKHPDYPEKLLETSECELWYRKDQKFKLPTAMYYFYLISGDSTKTAKNSVLLDLMMNLLSFAMTEEVYPATIANITHSFNVVENGMVIKIWGFNEKIPNLIDVIVKYLKDLNSFINEDMFKAVKETIQKHQFNKLLKPTNLAKELRLKILMNNYWMSEDKYLELLNVTFEDTTKFIENFKKELYLKVLVQGNVNQEVALETVQKFVQDFHYSPLPKEHYPLFLISQIPLGEKYLLVESFNKNDSNSITTNYHQVGQFSFKTDALIDMLMYIIEEPLFNILRTKEQLGYHVYCTARDTYGILGFSITVVSQVDKFTTQHLDERIEHFLKTTPALLDMDKESWESLKEDIIKTKEISDVYLKEEVDRNWSEIVNDDYVFDRIKREIESIRTVTLDELKCWWNKQNRFEGKENYRKLSIQVVGHSLKRAKECCEGNVVGNPVKLNILSDGIKNGEENSDKFVSNIDTFKWNLLLYPVRSIK